MSIPGSTEAHPGPPPGAEGLNFCHAGALEQVTLATPLGGRPYLPRDGGALPQQFGALLGRSQRAFVDLEEHLIGSVWAGERASKDVEAYGEET